MYTSFVLEPPYAEPVRLDTGVSAVLLRGSVVMLRPVDTADACCILVALQQCQARYPHVPVALWLDGVDPQAALGFASSAANRGFRSIAGAPTVDTLRTQLLDPAHLGTDVVERLRNTGRTVDDVVARFLSATLGEYRYCRKLEDVLCAAEISYGRLRRATAQCHMGRPGQIHMLLRSFSAAAELQREPQTTVAEVARRYGFWDDAALRSHLRDDLGTSPKYIRAWIGWQPLLVALLRRAGLSHSKAF
jgi:AraC-like DNA-binding protein